jgi:DNA-binding response OmpR family regulator
LHEPLTMQVRLDSDWAKLGRPARVLVAEDDPQNRQLIEEVCTSEGFEVEAVENGESALEAARSRWFDLVLLDAAMPGLNGLEVCRALKAESRTAAIPVIIVTASLEEVVRDRAIEVGCAAFITKPFRIFELSQRMRAAMRVRGVDGDPPTSPQIRLRRERADALSSLPSPSTLRTRVQRELELCARAGKPIVCAVVRLEAEEQLRTAVGRTSTDALLGGAVLELAGKLGGRMVRSDVDEVVLLVDESELPAVAAATAQIAGEGRLAAGVALGIEVSARWGAHIAEASGTDVDRVLGSARAAVEKAHRAGEPGSIDRA